MSEAFKTALSSILAACLKGAYRDMQQVQLEQIKADPVRHKLTMIMEQGADTRYCWYRAGVNGRRQSVRFCYSIKRNAAGYFLIWREIQSKRDTIRRDQFDAVKRKADASLNCRRLAERYKASRKK